MLVVAITARTPGTVAEKDLEFGQQMLDKFLHTLEKQPPDVVCFYTEGVYNVADDSPTLLGIRLLEGLGARVVACQSCLAYYGVAERRAVGEVVGMDEIVHLLTSAERVIRI